MSECRGDPASGVLTFENLSRPGHLQLSVPQVVGNPVPLVTTDKVSKRRKKRVSTSGGDNDEVEE